MDFELITMTKRQNLVVITNSLIKMSVQHSVVLRKANQISECIRKGVGNKPENITLLYKAMYTCILITAFSLG